MRTLFMQAPSYDGFDGGAGARYQAKREIRSYWYPTWLAQLAAMVPNSKLIDAAPHGIGAEEVVTEATHYDLAVLLGAGEPAVALTGLALASRMALGGCVRRRFGVGVNYWLLPLHDLAAFAVYLTSFFGASVIWRGQRYRVQQDGTLLQASP